MKLSRNNILKMLNGKKENNIARKKGNKSLRKNKSIDLKNKSLKMRKRREADGNKIGSGPNVSNSVGQTINTITKDTNLTNALTAQTVQGKEEDTKKQIENSFNESNNSENIKTISSEIKETKNAVIIPLNIYREKQENSGCGRHALNNLFGRKVFEKDELMNICEKINKDNDVKIIENNSGLCDNENYNADILIKVLQNNNLNYQLVFNENSTTDNKNATFSDTIKNNVENFKDKDIVGFIVNTGTHWYTIKKISFFGNDDNNIDYYIKIDSLIAPDTNYKVSKIEDFNINYNFNQSKAVIIVYKNKNKYNSTDIDVKLVNMYDESSDITTGNVISDITKNKEYTNASSDITKNKKSTNASSDITTVNVNSDITNSKESTNASSDITTVNVNSDITNSKESTNASSEVKKETFKVSIPIGVNGESLTGNITIILPKNASTSYGSRTGNDFSSTITMLTKEK
jgi:hypothetical protein